MWRHRLSMELHCRLLMLLLLIGSPLLLGVKGDCQPHLYTCESEFYPFGHIQNDDTLSKSQSRISDGIHLSEDFILYDEKISNVYISENGLILLENVSDNTVSKFVAPYYADADIRESGEVYFRQTNDPSLLQRANSEIRAAFSLPQNTTMQNLLIVTWFRVGYYSFNEIEDNKTNTFQCVLATSGLESFVIFLYAHGRIQWTTGDFEGGQNGLGGFTAMAAINAGDDVNYIIVPTSRTPEIINIDETSNVGIPGVWMFQVGKKYSVTVFLDPPAYGNTSNFEYLVGSKITLTCMVTPPPPSDSEFSWRCSTGCFVGMETEQSVKLDVTDSGELNCSVVVDGVEYTSKLIKLQAIAECRPELYTCESEFYPFGHSENDSTLPPSNDVDSEGMNLTTNLTYYDEQISRVYISDNGIIKFENGYVSPYPEYFPYPSKFVAPYWANVDLTGIGEVFYRQTTNPDLLARATNEIRAAFPVYHYITMKNLVIATWYRVGYYRRNVDKTNTFQCVLATDGYKSFVLFLYAYGRIQWTTGDDGDGVNGLGGDEALAGINGYFARSIAINGSETPDIINIDETSNVGIPGVWMLKLGEVPRYNASITSDPLNYGNNDNIIFEFNAGSNLTLICMVTPTPPSNSTFRWSCNGCSIDGKNEQSIYISEVDFSLRGEINCSVIVGYETYTSIPIRLGVIAKCQPEIFTCESEFYPFGYSHNDSSLPLRYSSISEGIQLSDDLIFYNERISRIYVTDNGIIYFDDNQAYTRYSNSFFLPRRGFKLVAPYWANAEIRGIGQVFYRQTTDPSLLARATSEIRAAFPEYQNVTMQSLLIATWYKVGYGGRFAIYTDKTNTFQCVLATDGVSSFIIFLYAHGRIQWTSGDGSGGKDGFGGREALAGINSGDGFNYITIPGSQTPDIINIDETSNVGIPGVWMFQTVKRFNAAVSPAWIFTRNNNTWMYPFGYNITLTCRVTPTPPSDSEFSWSCSAGCFVVVETEQSVNIKVTKSREINCAVIIDGMEYISEPIELQPVGYHVNVNVEARLQADVRVNANIVEYIAGTHFSLRCRATPTPPSDSEFSWSCSTGCIPNTKTKQRYNITELEGADSAELNCSVIIGDMEYTSQSVTLREIECQPVSYTCESEFYPFGYSNNDSSLPSYSDSNSGRIRLSEDLIFYDKRVDSIYVSENGIIDFDSVSYLHNPTALPRRGFKFVAPYLADVDTREAGQVFYRQTTDSSLLVRATSEITEAFPEHQNITMKNLIIATWYRVGYRSPFSRNANKTNTFQCVLATDGVESFVIFLYAHNKIQWTTGNTSDGLGGTGALVGINAGDGVNYVAIHGSLTPEIINITERSNVGIPGVWMFQISKRACQPELYTCLSEFYPFGLTQNDATLTMFDDTSSGEFH